MDGQHTALPSFNATSFTLSTSAVQLMQLPARPHGGWLVEFAELDGVLAEAILDRGARSTAVTYTVPASSGRSVFIPGGPPITIRANGRGSGGRIRARAWAVDSHISAPLPEFQLARATAGGSNFSDTAVDSIPPDADTLVIRAKTTQMNSHAVIRVQGSDGSSHWVLKTIYLGDGFIEDKTTDVAVAHSSPNLLGAMGGDIDEYEVSARISDVGSGGPFDCKVWALMSSSSVAGNLVEVAAFTLTNGGTSGARARVLIGAKNVYDDLYFSVAGTFSSDKITFEANGRGQEAAGAPGLGVGHGVTIPIAPGAFPYLTVTSSGVISGETLTVDAIAYRTSA